MQKFMKTLKVPPQVQVSPEGKAFVCCHPHKLRKHPFNPSRIYISISLFLDLSVTHTEKIHPHARLQTELF